LKRFHEGSYLVPGCIPISLRSTHLTGNFLPVRSSMSETAVLRTADAKNSRPFASMLLYVYEACLYA